MPWKPRTRQKQGRVTELQLLKSVGAVAHPMSGAGNIKEDGHDDDNLYEVKDCARSYRLDSRELKKTFVRAIRQGKNAKWMIYFTDEDFTAEIRIIPGGKELMEEA